MSDKPDPAAVEAANRAYMACATWMNGRASLPSIGERDAFKAGYLTAYRDVAALQAERDEALVEAYARATPIGAVPLPVKRGGQS